MKYDNAAMILSTVKISCPMCGKSYRQKFNLRNHIKGKHNDIEYDLFMEKINSNEKEIP